MDIVSKQGQIKASEKDFFFFLSDLRNLDEFIPADKIEDWDASEDECSFTMPKVGSITLQITEKKPYHLIRVEPSGGSSPFGFKFFIQMKEMDAMDTRIKLTLRAELNMMMKTMFQGPIKKGLDQMVDTLSNLDIPTATE